MSLTRAYVNGNNIDEVLQVKIGSDAYYCHTNVQGNMVALTDATGAVVETFKYDIYGRLTTWKGVPRQRCIAHKIRNVLSRVPKKHQAEVKREVTKIFYAANLEEALQAVKAFAAKYGNAFPAACGILAKDLGDCLTFYRFPQEHWKRLRTSNVIERAFKEVRRRTNVVGRFPTERSALTLIWATLEQNRLSWNGVRMDERILLAVEKAKEEAISEVIDLSILDIYLDAA